MPDPDPPIVVPPGTIPPGLQPAMVAFLQRLILRNRPLTARSVGCALKQFLGWATAARVDPLLATADQLAAFQSWLVTVYRTPNGAPLARTTSSARLSQVKSWYRWAYGYGLIAIDPSRHLGVVSPRSRVVVREYLTLQEATALIQTQAGVVRSTPTGTRAHAEAVRNLAAICLALATGRRIGGMTTLQVADLDGGRKELRIDREKGSTGRVLPIAAWASEAVTRYLREARPLLARGHDSQHLFLNMAGDGPIARPSLSRMLEQLVERTTRENPDLIELPAKHITWHSLRVSFATMLFSNGCDIRSVNELMLHRRLSTTACYTPIPIEDLRQVFRVAHPRP